MGEDVCKIRDITVTASSLPNDDDIQQMQQAADAIRKVGDVEDLSNKCDDSTVRKALQAMSKVLKERPLTAYNNCLGKDAAKEANDFKVDVSDKTGDELKPIVE